MKKTRLIILVMALGLYFCGQRERMDQLAEGKSASRGAAQQTNENRPAPLIIRSVAFNLDTLNTATDLTATPVMQDPGEENITFEFRWLVNNQEGPMFGATLEKSLFKKNDWIYCLVKATKGDRESPVFRSDYIRIPNTPPVLHPAPVPKFVVPGIFSYQIQAFDLDKDELTYKLISPLDLGIQIDTHTGLITWEVDRALAERCTTAVNITYEVSDSDGSTSSAAIRLAFMRKNPGLLP